MPRLRPRLVPTIAALVTAGVCARLGVWQLHRYGESAQRTAVMEAAHAAPPLDGVPAGGGVPFQRARAHGVWLDAPQALVNGGVVDGRPGYQVYAWLAQADGPALLVDRGWVPVDEPGQAAGRPTGAATVEGMLVPAEGGAGLQPTPGADGLARWPMNADLAYGVFPRVLGPPYAALVATAPAPAAPWVLLVGPRLSDSGERHLGSTPIPGYLLPVPQTHHLSYAAQWFAFASVAIGLWLWASWRKA